MTEANNSPRVTKNPNKRRTLKSDVEKFTDDPRRPLAAIGLGLIAASLAGLNYMNHEEVVASTEINIGSVPSEGGDISTIQDAVEDLVDNPESLANVTYEGHTIRDELEKSQQTDSNVTITVYENKWHSRVEVTPSSEINQE